MGLKSVGSAAAEFVRENGTSARTLQVSSWERGGPGLTHMTPLALSQTMKRGLLDDDASRSFHSNTESSLAAAATQRWLSGLSAL